MNSPSLYLLFLIGICHTAAGATKAAECRMIYDKYDYQAAASRNFMFGEVWPKKEIPFVMSSGFSNSERKLIYSAMRHVENNVCVKWVRRKRQKNYVLIKHNEQGCFASLGYDRRRGQHVLNLQKTDKSGATCMHTRADRDKYVKIHWKNIERDNIHNFFRSIEVGSTERPPKCDPLSTQKFFDSCVSGYRTDTFGMAYDYGSIMHYGLNV
ncbi:Metalloendopeptidase, partial [Caligus rogercresseyi]